VRAASVRGRVRVRVRVRVRKSEEESEWEMTGAWQPSVQTVRGVATSQPRWALISALRNMV